MRKQSKHREVAVAEIDRENVLTLTSMAWVMHFVIADLGPGVHEAIPIDMSLIEEERHLNLMAKLRG